MNDETTFPSDKDAYFLLAQRLSQVPRLDERAEGGLDPCGALDASHLKKEQRVG